MPLIAFIFILVSWNTAFAEAATDICEVLNIKNCPGVSKQGRRSSAQSLPSVISAAQFNPANVSHDRGFGIETFYQPANSPSLNIVSGTGKVGAALVSTNLENSFFGNKVLELGSNYLARRMDKKQYKSHKYNLALGAGLWKNRNVSWDIGLMLKYNTEIKRVNPGLGTSFRFGILTLGASFYQDDVKLNFLGETDPISHTPYTSYYGVDTYQEKFTVHTYFAGIKLKNLFLDAGFMQTRYKFYNNEASVIRLFSASYIYKNFLLNLALRNENSPAPKFDGGQLITKQKEQDLYGGVQYSFNQHFIAGIHYNYYLLNEVAGSLTVFF